MRCYGNHVASELPFPAYSVFLSAAATESFVENQGEIQESKRLLTRIAKLTIRKSGKE